MLKDIVAATAMPGHRLHLRLEDGVEGEVDVARLLRFKDVLAALQNPTVFAAVRVEPEAGTVVWPNGADLDPDVLYAAVTGISVKARLAPAVAS